MTPPNKERKDEILKDIESLEMEADEIEALDDSGGNSFTVAQMREEAERLRKLL